MIVMSELLKDENIFYSEISELLKQARNVAYKTINTIMVQTYWQTGKRIVEQEQHGQYRANYGDYLITNLSRYLSDTIGKGFSFVDRQMRISTETSHFYIDLVFYN